jgi:hypothetical protein
MAQIITPKLPKPRTAVYRALETLNAQGRWAVAQRWMTLSGWSRKLNNFRSEVINRLLDLGFIEGNIDDDIWTLTEAALDFLNVPADAQPPAPIVTATPRVPPEFRPMAARHSMPRMLPRAGSLDDIRRGSLVGASVVPHSGALAYLAA